MLSHTNDVNKRHTTFMCAVAGAPNIYHCEFQTMIITFIIFRQIACVYDELTCVHEYA